MIDQEMELLRVSFVTDKSGQAFIGGSVSDQVREMILKMSPEKVKLLRRDCLDSVNCIFDNIKTSALDGIVVDRKTDVN